MKLLASLLARLPQSVNDCLGERTAADLGRLAVLGQLNAAQAAHGDFDAALKLAERTGSSMLAPDGQKRRAVLICIFDLVFTRLAMHRGQACERLLTVAATSSAAPGITITPGLG